YLAAVFGFGPRTGLCEARAARDYPRPDFSVTQGTGGLTASPRLPRASVPAAGQAAVQDRAERAVGTAPARAGLLPVAQGLAAQAAPRLPGVMTWVTYTLKWPL